MGRKSPDDETPEFKGVEGTPLNDEAGVALRKAREILGWSQAKFGELLGTELGSIGKPRQSTISSWEGGGPVPAAALIAAVRLVNQSRPKNEIPLTIDELLMSSPAYSELLARILEPRLKAEVDRWLEGRFGAQVPPESGPGSGG